jgi:hypothetical protein
MAAPLDDFADLLAAVPPAPPARVVFDAAAILGTVLASGLRAIVVHGPTGSGRAHVADVVVRGLRAAGRAVVLDDSRKHSPQGESARSAILAHLRATRAVALVFVYTRAVKAEDVLNLHTVELVSEVALHAHYGLSRRAFVRTYRGSLTDVRHVHEYGLPLPVRDVAHNAGRCSMYTVDPTCPAILERIMQHETRRKSHASIREPDAYSDADIMLTHAARLDEPPHEMVVHLARAMVDARSRGAHAPQAMATLAATASGTATESARTGSDADVVPRRIAARTRKGS